MGLKGDETIVAEVLKKHFGVLSYDEVDNDPPDIAQSEGRDVEGNLVAEFWFTWTFKPRS